MNTHDYESYHPGLSTATLSWAFNDEDEVTIFDSQSDVTTNWLTIDEDYVCDLDECV